MFFDLHCDTLTAIEDVAHGAGQTSVDKLAALGGAAQCFAIFLDKKQGPLWPRFEHYCDRLEALMAQDSRLQLALSPDEALQIVKRGNVAAILTVEGGDLLAGDMANLHRLYRRGVRLLTLCWNYPNALGYPNIDCTLPREQIDVCRTDGRGLTAFGLDVVDQMNALGMMVDVSHLSDGGFWEALKRSKAPIVASHSNARALCGVGRNLSDEMIAALARRGGVMGLCFCYDFLTSGGGEWLDMAVAHARHIYDVGGADVLALGSDFDGIPPVAGCDCTALPLLARRLADVLPAEAVDKMLWSNAMRVWRSVQQYAKSR